MGDGEERVEEFNTFCTHLLFTYWWVKFIRNVMGESFIFYYVGDIEYYSKYSLILY